MNENWLGITVSSTRLVIVGLGYEHDVLTAIDRDEWQLPVNMTRPDAYTHIYHRVRNYVTERHISAVAIGTSAVAPGATATSLVKTAELRGAVIPAANCPLVQVHLVDKAVVSRVFGTRKFKEYVADDTFWEVQLEGEHLPKKYREAALCILAARQK